MLVVYGIIVLIVLGLLGLVARVLWRLPDKNHAESILRKQRREWRKG